MSDCTCSPYGDGPDIDCLEHGECAFYGHPLDGGPACHCGAIAATLRCPDHGELAGACTGCADERQGT